MSTTTRRGCAEVAKKIVGKKHRKVHNMVITADFLQSRTKFLAQNNWPKSKWIYFCEEMMRLGFQVELYEARQTKSKYCTVKRAVNSIDATAGCEREAGKSFKVRFSDHVPIYHREMAGDCDFFVGKTHTGVRNTHDAINAVCNFFEIERIAGRPNPKNTNGFLIDFI